MIRPLQSSNSNVNLLNAIDGSCGLDARAFDQSIAMNVLFQDKLIVYDTSLFTCHNLFEHMSGCSSSISLFQSACTEGIITPLIRDRSFSTARSYFRHLKNENLIHEESVGFSFFNNIVNSFDYAFEKELRHPFYSPEGVKTGEFYEREVLGLLSREFPPTNMIGRMKDRGRADHFGRLWLSTKSWRTDVVQIALERTKMAGHSGLRRQDIFDVLGNSIGLSGKLITYNELNSFYDDKERKLLMDAFIRWLSQCHFISQARALGISINFPVYNYDNDFALDSILRSSLDDGPEPEEGFRCEVMLPEIAKLCRLDPSNLMAIRKELGLSYFVALKEWQSEPSNEKLLEELMRVLKHYCSQITMRYAEVKPTRIEVLFSSRTINKLAGVGSSHVLGKLDPVYGLLKTVGSIIFSAVRDWRDGENHRPVRQDIELVLPLK